MSLESFTTISISDKFLVGIITDNLHKIESYDYRYEHCIAQIELNFRQEYRERAYYEFNRLPVKSTYYDEEKQRFEDSGRILIRTDLYDFTLYQGSSQSVRLKKHSLDNTHALPLEEGDAQHICEGLTAHSIKIPKSLEVDMIQSISKGKSGGISQTISYPVEEGLIASVADKVSHSIWGFFHKTN
jgi:hypothetical protein